MGGGHWILQNQRSWLALPVFGNNRISRFLKKPMSKRKRNTSGRSPFHILQVRAACYVILGHFIHPLRIWRWALLLRQDCHGGRVTVAPYRTVPLYTVSRTHTESLRWQRGSKLSVNSGPSTTWSQVLVFRRFGPKMRAVFHKGLYLRFK